MKTVLLTGAGGFIGRTAIRPLLDSGYTVHAITSKRLEEKDPNLFYHDVDLLDQNTARRLCSSINPSHLLHFAWYVEHGKFWDAPENKDWVAASLNLLKAFAVGGGKRVVMAGTCAEYDWQTGEKSFLENSSPINPATVYGKAKHDLHLALEVFSRNEGLSYAWGRIFFLFGPFEPPNRFVPSIIRSLLQNEEAKCSHGNQIRDFMFVEDAGRAFVKLLNSDVQGPLNIADGEPRKMKDLGAMIVKMLGTPELLKLNAVDPVKDEPVYLVADTSRLKNEVNFIIEKYLTFGLKKSIDWWKQNL